MNEFVPLSMWLDMGALHPVSDSAPVTGPTPSLDIDIYLLPVACASCLKLFQPHFFFKKEDIISSIWIKKKQALWVNILNNVVN